MAPWAFLAFFPSTPGAELRPQSQCNDPIQSSEGKEGVACLGGLTPHTCPPQQSVDGHETERVLDLSPDPEVLAERTVPQGQLLRVLVLRARESGHVAGDSPEGVEQGRLHAGLKEQQVHVNLL